MDAALAADQQLIEIRSRLSDKRAGVSGRSPPGDRPCGRILRRGCQSSPRCSRGHRWSGNCRCSRLGPSRRRTSAAFRRWLGFGDPVRGLSDVVGRQTRNARGLVDGNFVRSKHLIKATPSPRVIRSAKRRRRRCRRPAQRPLDLPAGLDDHAGRVLVRVLDLHRDVDLQILDVGQSGARIGNTRQGRRGVGRSRDHTCGDTATQLQNRPGRRFREVGRRKVAGPFLDVVPKHRHIAHVND